VKIILYSIFFLIIPCLSIAGTVDKFMIGGLDGMDPLETRPPYEVKLALSGGGARGLATIGILVGDIDRCHQPFFFYQWGRCIHCHNKVFFR